MNLANPAYDEGKIGKMKTLQIVLLRYLDALMFNQLQTDTLQT